MYTERFYAVFAKLACYVRKIWAYIESVEGLKQPKEGFLGGERGKGGLKHGVLRRYAQGGRRHITQVLSGLSVEASVYMRFVKDQDDI